MINNLKNTYQYYWIFYAALFSLLSALIVHILSKYIHFNELTSHTFPGTIYGVALYFIGTTTRIISGNTLKHIIVFTILTLGTTSAWYAAITNIFNLSQGEELGNLQQMIISGGIGAFIVSLLLLFSWNIKQYPLRFISFITIIGGVGGLSGYAILRYTHSFLNDDVRMLLLFFVWQSAVAISACLFVTRHKNESKKA